MTALQRLFVSCLMAFLYGSNLLSYLSSNVYGGVEANVQLHCPPSTYHNTMTVLLRTMPYIHDASSINVTPERPTEFPECPQTHTVIQDEPTELPPAPRQLRLQTVCPWKYEYDYDHDRFPRLLLYAKCLCDKCLIQSLQHQERNPDGPPPLSDLHTCQTHYEPRTVIREVCVWNQKHIRWSTEQVPVACVCTHPYSIDL